MPHAGPGTSPAYGKGSTIPHANGNRLRWVNDDGSLGGWSMTERKRSEPN